MSISLNSDSVAQLGERHLDRVEVAGSNPVGITHTNLDMTLFFENRNSVFFFVCVCQ